LEIIDQNRVLIELETSGRQEFLINHLNLTSIVLSGVSQKTTVEELKKLFVVNILN
jgi:hypothetical protein